MNFQSNNILKCAVLASLLTVYAACPVRAADSGKSTGGASSSGKIYTGVYNGRQIIPNTMAIYCKTNAEDMLQDTKKLSDCINLLIKNLKSSDASTRQEAQADYGLIRYEELSTMMAQSIAKGAAIANYEEVQNSVGDAVSQTQTEHEDNVAAANALSISTDVINSMRDLYAERLKYEAVLGIETVDISAIADVSDSENVLENKSSSKTSSEGTGKEGSGEKGSKEEGENGTSEGVKSSDTAEMCSKDGLNKITTHTVISSADGIGKCSDGKNTAACPDGLYESNGTGYIVCRGGNCISCLDEVVVEGTGKGN